MKESGWLREFQCESGGHLVREFHITVIPLAIVVILTQAAPYYNYIEGQISSRQEGL